tara:strand:+ start:2089 stop:2817 length:729 start_codon:yes stop_codon:yes gene_type:complete
VEYSNVPIQPAATVVCTRQNEENKLEVLLLRRNRKLKFASGFWVFPGGKIESSDSKNGSITTESAAQAAKREAEEEASLNLYNNDLIHFMNWTTPSPSIKRFNTWFFICHLKPEESNVIVDDSEIKEYTWTTPKEAIETLGTNDLRLLPPTFLTLVRMMGCHNFTDVKREIRRTAPLDVIPRTGMINGVFHSMYKGDAGYESHNINLIGPRHRISGKMDEGSYNFEYEGCDHIFPVNGGYQW